MFKEVERERQEQLLNHFNCMDGMTDAEKEAILRESSIDQQIQGDYEQEYEQYAAELSMSQPYKSYTSSNDEPQSFGNANSGHYQSGYGGYNIQKRGTVMDIER